MKSIFRITLFFVFAILYACKAPHTNPLDPENPDNEFRGLRGRLLTETIPRQPIEGASISWEIDNIVVKSNVNGEFSLDKLSNVDGWLKFNKDGYLPDSQRIEW